MPHAQHIHGATTGTGHYMCPSMEADLDGDGLLTNEEASGEYGDVFMALTTEGDASAESGLAVDRMPVADSEGRLDYDRTFSADELPDGLVDQLEHVHVVQHGIDVNGNGEYDIDGAGVSTFAENLGVPDVPEEATDPASCGVVTGAMATRAPQGGVETGGGDADRLGRGRTCCRARSPAAHRVHGRPLAHQARPRPRVIAGTRAMKTLVASLVGLFGLVLLGALLLDDPNDSSTPTGGDAESTVTDTAGTRSSPTSAATSSFDQRLDHCTDHVDLADPPSATGSASEPRIDTSDLFYFGEPFETIQIPGTYVGVDGPERLRLQIRRAAGWTWFPLPVFTQPSGEFRAFVELGAGQYRLRLVDPETGVKSQVLTVLVV